MIEIKSGKEKIKLSKHDNCVAIVHREWNPHSQEYTTTPLFITDDRLADMIRPLVEVAQYVSENKEASYK